MASNDSLQRSVLPIPDRKPIGLTNYDAKDPDTKFPPITQLRPPTGAPNVLVILLDDVGFGASSAFGGPCQIPTAEKLAAKGLKYTRFHTTALCSPTRAAMLSGRNHHAVGMGGITEIATSAPGYNSLRPNTCAPLAEVLKLNGYSLLFFNADYFKDRVRAVINDTNIKTKWVLFNAESVPLLDVTGADALEELRSELAGREIVLAVARGKGLFRVMLERTGVAGRIGAERLFPTVRAGAEAFLERAP